MAEINDYSGIATNAIWYIDFVLFVIVLVAFFLLFLYVANLHYVSYNKKYDMRQQPVAAPKPSPLDGVKFCLRNRGPSIRGRRDVATAILTMPNKAAETSYSLNNMKHPKRIIRTERCIPRCTEPCNSDDKPVLCDRGCIWFCRLVGSIMTIAVCYYFAYALIKDSKFRFGIFVH